MDDERRGSEPSFLLCSDLPAVAGWHLLDRTDAELADRFITSFALAWLRESKSPEVRLLAAPGTVRIWEAEIAPAFPRPGALALESFDCGATLYLTRWDGSSTKAIRWIEEAAHALGSWVVRDRERGRTPTDLDSP